MKRITVPRLTLTGFTNELRVWGLSLASTF